MAYSEEWAIGYVGGWKKAETRGPSRELVVHSVEWTTSWVGKAGKRTKLDKKSRASGPLRRVDH